MTSLYLPYQSANRWVRRSGSWRGIRLARPERSGCCTSIDLRGRILLAQALAFGDVGRLTMIDSQEGRATFVDCGRREGCYDEILIRLGDIAEWVRRNDRMVTWA